MTTVILPIPDIYESYTRPVVDGILNELIGQHYLPSGVDRVVYNDYIEVDPKTGSRVPVRTSPEAKYSGDNYIHIDSESVYTDTGGLINPNIRRGDPVFRDNTGFILNTHYRLMRLSLKFTYVAGSVNEIREWVEKFTTRYDHSGVVTKHRLNYSYALPHAYLPLMEEVYGLREHREGYGEDFKDYFFKYSPDNFVISSNLVGNAIQFRITETQSNVQGRITSVPILNSKDNTSYEGSFGVELDLTKPTSIYATYPEVIHNKLMSNEYLPTIDPVVDEKTNYYNGSEVPLNRGNDEDAVIKTYPIRHPAYDRKRLDFYNPTYVPLLTLWVTLDEDGKFLMDLNEIDDMIDPNVLEFLRHTHDTVFKYDHNVFNIAVHGNDDILDQERLTMTPDLRIFFKKPMSFRNEYRVTLLLKRNLDTLTVPSILSLISEPTVVEIVLSTLLSLNVINEGIYNYLTTQPLTPRVIKQSGVIEYINDTPGISSNRISVVNAHVLVERSNANHKASDYPDGGART